MLKRWKQCERRFGSVAGFTLTEVMIGITILTVAIVSATNLLVGLLNTNQNNLTSLQAYYIAQEGLEAVRNIRDTNWLHNQPWLGSESSTLWGGQFELNGNYAVDLSADAFNQGLSYGLTGDINALSSVRPWSIGGVFGGGAGGGGEVYRYITGGESGFKRTISIKPYEDLEDYVLVESKVEWELGSKHRELVLSTILTNWKGGAL